MTGRRDDNEIVRLKRRLKDAQAERDEVRRRGAAHVPLVERLEQELEQNRFAARLFAALKENRRRA